MFFSSEIDDITTSGQLLSSLSSENLKMSLANSDGLSDKEDTIEHMKHSVAHHSVVCEKSLL